MEMIFCPNCGKPSGFKRALGFGTLFMVVITFGLWLLVVPFYTPRCINCGLTRTSAFWENLRTDPRKAVTLSSVVAIVLCVLLAFSWLSRPASERQPAPITYGPNYNNPTSDQALGTAAPKSMPEPEVANDSSPTHLLRVDASARDSEPRFVRGITGRWSRPARIYSDDEVKVYIPYDDKWTLIKDTPRDWLNTKFQVLIFSDCRRPTPKRAGAIETLRSGGAVDPERLSYMEERVLIDSVSVKYTVLERQSIDENGESFAMTPSNWEEVRDLGDPQYPVTREITTTILWQLTEPQLTALNALGLGHMDEESWNRAWSHKIGEHYTATAGPAAQ
jgi:hypothetical protein